MPIMMNVRLRPPSSLMGAAAVWVVVAAAVAAGLSAVGAIGDGVAITWVCHVPTDGADTPSPRDAARRSARISAALW